MQKEVQLHKIKPAQEVEKLQNLTSSVSFIFILFFFSELI
jgi:hypothetical protein